MTHELRVHDFLSDSTPCHQKNLSLSTQINFKGEKEKQQQEKKKKRTHHFNRHRYASEQTANKVISSLVCL